MGNRQFFSSPEAANNCDEISIILRSKILKSVSCFPRMIHISPSSSSIDKPQNPHLSERLAYLR